MNRVLILAASGFRDYELVKQKMNEVIAEEDCLLFDVVCGGQTKIVLPRQKSLGERWAEEFGAPIYWIRNDDIPRLMQLMLVAADYLLAFYDGEDAIIRKMIGAFKTAGKHGKVVKI